MKVGELFVKMAMDYSQYDKDEAKAKGRVEGLGAKLTDVLRGAFSFSLGMGLVQGFRSLGGAVTDFINTASRTEVLNVALQSVARASGYAVSAINEQKDTVMGLGIAEQEATQILTRFMQAQLNTADAAKLARVAQDAAVIAGYNSSQAAEQMTEAIAKQRPELLSAFGMTRNMNDIYNDYARTIGRTATQLTEAQKKQAMLNYILVEGEKIAGTYEASMGAVGKQIGSLPRYWDTLKNAIATPLALPVVGVIVDGITSSLKTSIAWAKTNQATLQRWGQSVANAARTAWMWVAGFTGAVVTHWGVVRQLTLGVVWAFLTFKSISLALAWTKAATDGLAVATKILNGEAIRTTITTGFLKTAVDIYNVQIRLASMSTIAHTGVLQVLRTALYSVNAALGPVGWAIIAISAALGAGVSLWSKYNSQVQAAAQKAQMDKINAQQKAYIDSVNKAAAGTNAQADALGGLGKASKDNLQSFDEVHQLMEQTAAVPVASPEAATPDVPGLSGFEMPDFGADLNDSLESAKPTVSGFIGWLSGGFKNWASGFGEALSSAWENVKAGAVSAWDGLVGALQKSWNGITTGASNTWAKVKTDAATAWESIKTSIGTKWDDIKAWASTTWQSITSGAASTWENVKANASTAWEGIKTSLGNVWAGLATGASSTWTNIKSSVASGWQEIQTNAPIAWDNIKTAVQTRWDSLKTNAGSTWEDIKTTVSTKWDELKTNAPTVWDNIKGAISQKWQELKTDAPSTWENIKTAIATKWDELKADAPTVWENIKTSIATRFGEAKNSVIQDAGSMRDEAPKSWAELLTSISGKKTALLEAIASPWTEAKTTVLGIVDSARNWGRNLVDNFIAGIKSMFTPLKAATNLMMSQGVSDFMAFQSPAKEGPGRTADQWAPNLVRMYAQGILANVSMVRSAAGAVMQSLAPMTVAPSMAIVGAAGMGGSGLAGGRMRSMGVSSRSGYTPELHLHIGTLVADKQGLKELERKLREVRVGEDQRTGQER